MVTHMLKWLMLSIVIITIGHYLYEFYTLSHSPPKLRDIQNERNAEYEKLRKLVPCHDSVDCIPNKLPNMQTMDEPGPPSRVADESTDKEALKAFMRQIGSDSTPL